MLLLPADTTRTLTFLITVASTLPPHSLALQQQPNQDVSNGAHPQDGADVVATQEGGIVNGPLKTAYSVFSHAAGSFSALRREHFNPFDAPSASLLNLDGLEGQYSSEGVVRKRRGTQDVTIHKGKQSARRWEERLRNFAFERHRAPSDTGGSNFFKSASWKQWGVLLASSVGLLVLDIAVFSKLPQTFKVHLLVISTWVVLGMCYAMWIESSLGGRKGLAWIYGYMLEWLLSMDNLFMFYLVFRTFKTPLEQTRKAVFVGIFCALFFRLCFYLVVGTLLHAFGWMRWPIGGLLVYSGVLSVWGAGDDDGAEVGDMRTVKALKLLCGRRLRDSYDPASTAMIVYDEQGGWQLSMLFVVVMFIEMSDIVFALDSVSAKISQIPDQYVAFSSAVLAMYALRAAYFIIQDLMHMFEFLHHGLALIIIYIGVDLMFSNVLKLSKGFTCCCIVSVFLICISASVIQQQLSGIRATHKHARMPGNEGGIKAK